MQGLLARFGRLLSCPSVLLPPQASFALELRCIGVALDTKMAAFQTNRTLHSRRMSYAGASSAGAAAAAASMTAGFASGRIAAGGSPRDSLRSRRMSFAAGSAAATASPTAGVMSSGAYAGGGSSRGSTRSWRMSGTDAGLASAAASPSTGGGIGGWGMSVRTRRASLAGVLEADPPEAAAAQAATAAVVAGPGAGRYGVGRGSPADVMATDPGDVVAGAAGVGHAGWSTGGRGKQGRRSSSVLRLFGIGSAPGAAAPVVPTSAPIDSGERRSRTSRTSAAARLLWPLPTPFAITRSSNPALQPP